MKIGSIKFELSDGDLDRLVDPVVQANIRVDISGN